MKAAVLVCFVISMIAMLFLIYTTFSIPMVKSGFGIYCIEQQVRHENPGFIEPPYVQTVVWYNQEIVMDWYDHIDSDSTAIKAKVVAEQWVKKIEANEPKN